MNSIDLLKLKNDTRCVLLNEMTISTILGFFNQSNIKTFKVVKKQVNILKNNRIQGKKDLNENKLIMIMNKISHNNINSLIKEYLSTITINTQEEYNSIQDEIICKLIKDITFIDNYIPFIIKVFSIEKYKLSFDPEYFINTLYSIIQSNYNKLNQNNDISNIMDPDNESERIACLTIIKKLISFNFFKIDLYHYISKLLLSQQYYKIDVYYWFVDLVEYKNIYKLQIHTCISECNKSGLKREELMLETLFDDNIKPIESVVPSVPKKFSDIVLTDKFSKPINTTTNHFIILIQNIIDEYLYLEILDEVGNFIINECKDLNEKNIFCQELIKIYFTGSKRPPLLLLFDYLIKKKYIFKSNLSKGLLLYLENNTINSSDPIDTFLKFLRSNNITNNIEHVFKKYRVKL
jgi:hypothetical protein